MPLASGDRVPAFTRTAHNGETLEIGNGPMDDIVVLYFYPKDETAGCTAEACTFRDEYEDFVEAGAKVVGVSPDSLDSHRKFAEHHRLPFLLLSDEDGSLRRSFDVRRTLGLIPGRATFVIDRQGVVRHVFVSQLRAKQHVSEALDVVKRLAAKG